MDPEVHVVSVCQFVNTVSSAAYSAVLEGMAVAAQLTALFT